MSEITLPEYQSVTTELQKASLSVTPAEMHGLLAGMLSGGVSIEDKSWQSLIFDYTNEGMGWSDNALRIATTSFSALVSELTSSEMTFTLMLPAEKASLVEQADALSEWVSHFISGLGLGGISLKDVAEDVKEALNDLEEISKLGIDEDDDLEEQADLLQQVIEHVKACVLTIHAEYGIKPKTEKAPTLH